MENRNNEILADVINNKKFEIEIELDFYLNFIKSERKQVLEDLEEMRNDPYFYQEHSEFLDDFMTNGELRFVKEYTNFCNKLCPKNEKGENISAEEFLKIAKRDTTKKKFKKYLINKTNRKLKKLEKCFIEFCDDDKYYELQQKILEMKKMKKDVELDIEELTKKINPSIFPDLEQRVNKYKTIAAKNRLFFSNLFDEILKFLDDTNKEISELYNKNLVVAQELDLKISRLYIEFFNCLDDYVEKSIALSECEEWLKEIKQDICKINQQIIEE